MAFNVLRQLATRSPIAMRERIALLAPSFLHSNATTMMWRGNVSAQQYSQNNKKCSSQGHLQDIAYVLDFHETTYKKKEIDILLTQLTSKLFCSLGEIKQKEFLWVILNFFF